MFDESLAERWPVEYRVTRISGDTGTYNVTYKVNKYSVKSVDSLTATNWLSESLSIEEKSELTMDFTRLTGKGQYRIRIFVGGSWVEEGIVSQNEETKFISYVIPGDQ